MAEAGESIDGKFDPLALDVLSSNLRDHLRACPLNDFPPTRSFGGAGVYALYYVGSLEIYSGLANSDVPIYVGKAEAGNSSYGESPDDARPKLYSRIADKHAGSVMEVQAGGGNLSLTDFRVRYMRLDDVWIVLAERALLRAYVPVLWNTLMPGFGANPPGSARRNARSIWDSMHPGRRRAGELCNRRFTRSEMHSRIQLGIEVSLLPAGQERDDRLAALRALRAQMIWSPPKGGGNKPLRVYRVEDFITENAAIGNDLSSVEWEEAQADEAPMPDPEEEAEIRVDGAGE